MTPTKAGTLGVVVGAACSMAVTVCAFLVYDELTYTPSTKEGSCDHARYYFNLTVLGSSVIGDIVIKEPDNQEIRDPNPNWLVDWQSGGNEVEHIKTEGTGSPGATSFANDLSDTDEGGTRSVWIKRTDSDRWCKLTSSLG